MSMSFEERWNDLGILQRHYEHFDLFLSDVMQDVLGFRCSDIQLDIGRYLETGPLYKMVQAQRGQAKTTITAIYAVWRIIHDPKIRVVVITAGDTLSQEIATLMIRVIEDMPELACLKADTTIGDRSSVKAYDIHRDLKGVDKSPTLSCIGITGTLQGKRADLLIADDIESSKNSQTAVQRARLLHLTRDFTAIASTGEIVYLGTPQNTDSVYNSLPSRGFDVRIWPGRYPTKEEVPNYHNFLAPLLRERIDSNPELQTGGGPLGKRGQPIDSVIQPESILCKKEIDQGPSYFQLQYMLDTKLMDADRYPLKTKNLVFMSIPENRAPCEINWAAVTSSQILPPIGFPIQDPYYRAVSTGGEFDKFVGTMMYVDPAGGGKNADELAWAVTKFFAGRIYLVACGGFIGGFTPDKLKALTDVAVRWRPQTIHIEENFGKGAFRQIWQPVLFKEHKCHVEDVWESGQKELRIIDILEPIIAYQRLVIDESLIEQDWLSVQKYPAEHRATYSLFFQMARITKDKGALTHDDRLDALAGSCRFWVNALAQDAAKIAAKVRNEQYQKMIRDPLGTGRPCVLWGKTQRKPNALDKWRRK